MTRAKIRVTLKPTVLDAQGAVVQHALQSLGYNGVEQVRMGKYIELDLADGGDANAQVKEMCERLLTNPIIESYAFELEPERAGRPPAHAARTSGAARVPSHPSEAREGCPPTDQGGEPG